MQIAYSSPEGFTSLQVSPQLHDVKIAPSATLTHFLQTLVPEVFGLCPAVCRYSVVFHAMTIVLQSATLKPLSARDVLISHRQQFALQLTYKLTLEAGAEITPVVNKIHNVCVRSSVCCSPGLLSDWYALCRCCTRAVSMPSSSSSVTHGSARWASAMRSRRTSNCQREPSPSASRCSFERASGFPVSIVFAWKFLVIHT